MNMAALTYVCASRAELRTTRGRRAVLVGMACSKAIPEGPLALWAYGGSLLRTSRVGEPVEGVRIVDINGTETWRRPVSMQPSGLREVTVLETDRVVDDPAHRLSLAARTGADIVNMEAGILARTNRLHRIVCVVSDGPDHSLHLVAFGLQKNGEIDWNALGWALRIDFWRTVRTLARVYFKARRTLRGLRFA